MTNKNISSDVKTSRTHQKRKVTYTPPSYLDAPNPNDDCMKYRWLRVSMGGEDDARNIAKKKREGYEFVRKEEHPDFDVPVHESGKYAGVIGSGDLVLAKIPVEMAEAKNDYYQNKTRTQTEAVDADILKEQNPSMPITQQRRSSVSFGKKKKEAED